MARHPHLAKGEGITEQLTLADEVEVSDDVGGDDCYDAGDVDGVQDGDSNEKMKTFMTMLPI